VLRLKFQKLHSTVVNSVNPSEVLNVLFSKAVIGAVDMRALVKSRDDPQQQCNELLVLLHTSDNPEAFIQLYRALRREPQLQWLIERIDNCTDDKPATDPVRKTDIDKPTGKCMFQRYCDTSPVMDGGGGRGAARRP